MREKGRYFEKKIWFYLGLAIKESTINFIKYWRLRNKFNLSSFVFKYAILIVVKTTLKWVLYEKSINYYKALSRSK